MSRVVIQFLFLAVLGTTKTQPCDAMQDTRLPAVKEIALSRGGLTDLGEHVNRILQDNSRELQNVEEYCRFVEEDLGEIYDEIYDEFSCSCSQSGTDFSLDCESGVECDEDGGCHQFSFSSLIRNGTPVTNTNCYTFTGAFNDRFCATHNYCADGVNGCSCCVTFGLDNRSCNSCSFCNGVSGPAESVSLDCSNLASGAVLDCELTSGGGPISAAFELAVTIIAEGGGTGGEGPVCPITGITSPLPTLPPVTQVTSAPFEPPTPTPLDLTTSAPSAGVNGTSNGTSGASGVSSTLVATMGMISATVLFSFAL